VFGVLMQLDRASSKLPAEEEAVVSKDVQLGGAG
jgi:hypothetical protein